ncbi:MAG: DUF4153 domain-containing protein [Pseudomonadota bacterium]
MNVLARLASTLIPDISALQRFPVPVALALALTLLLQAKIETVMPGAWGDGRYEVALVLGFLAALATTMGVDPKGRGGLMPALMAALAAGLMGLLVWQAEALALQPTALGLALALSISLAPFIARHHDLTYWRVSHDTWVGFAMACLAAIIANGGLLAILATLKYLFGIEFPSRIAGHISVIAGCFIAPVVWLGLMPRRAEGAQHTEAAERVDDGDEEGGNEDDNEDDSAIAFAFINIAITGIVTYVLVPLLLTYAVILHAYAVKVGLEGVLPRGRIGWLVTSFGAVLALTALLVYPTRGGNAWLRFFWRVWPWLLVVPVGLLVLALAVRVEAYGWTQNRYLLALAALWFAALIVLHGLRFAWRDLRTVAGTLALLLALSAFGPWGVNAWPERSQRAYVRDTLEALGIVKDGRVIAKAEAQAKFAAAPPAQVQRLSRALFYLGRRGALGPFADLFDATQDAGLRKALNAPSRSRWLALTGRTARRYQAPGLDLEARLGLPDQIQKARRRAPVLRFARRRLLLPAAGGPYWLDGTHYAFTRTKRPAQGRTGAGETVYAWRFDGATLTFRIAKGNNRPDAADADTVFDLAQVSAKLKAVGYSEPKPKPDGVPMILAPKSGDAPLKVVIVEARGARPGASDVPASGLRTIQFYVLIPAKRDANGAGDQR